MVTRSCQGHGPVSRHADGKVMLHLEEMCGPGEINGNTSNVQTSIHVARSMVKHVREFSAERKAALGKTKAEARQCQKIERHLSFCFRRWEIQRNYEERVEKFGINYGVSYAMQVASVLRKHNLEDVKGITRATMR